MDSCSVQAPAYQTRFNIEDELSKYPVYARPLGLEGKAVQFTHTAEMETAGDVEFFAGVPQPKSFWPTHRYKRLFGADFRTGAV